MIFVSAHNVEHTAEEAINSIVINAPGYYDEEVESLRRMVEKQTDILGAIVSLLTEEQQASLITKAAYGWHTK